MKVVKFKKLEYLIPLYILIFLLFSGCIGSDITPGFGSIQINSIPAGAKIYLDGTDIGLITPALINSVESGSHLLKLELFHYQIWESTETVNTGETTMKNITLTYLPEQELIIQPALEGKDTFINERNPNSNSGELSYLYVGKNYPGYEYRIYVEFDLSSFPENAVMIDASISLYFHTSSEYGDSIEIGAHRVAGDWTEEDLTWDIQPAYNPTPIGILSITDYSTKKYYTWNIKDLVEGWLTGTIANHGLIFKYNGYVAKGHWVRFVSSDFATYLHKPKLTITYFLP